MGTTSSQHHETEMDLMQDIIAIRDELWAEETVVVSGELSEEFAMLDPDLAALHKDMKTAAAQLSQAKKSGHMAEIAKWRFESMETAFQTRMLEVRHNKMAADKKKAEKAMQQEKRELHELSMQQTMNEQFAKIREKKLKEKQRKKSTTGTWLFFFILGYWLAQINAKRLEQDRLRYTFTNARRL